jgi:hypothetical protein
MIPVLFNIRQLDSQHSPYALKNQRLWGRNQIRRIRRDQELVLIEGMMLIWIEGDGDDWVKND